MFLKKKKKMDSGETFDKFYADLRKYVIKSCDFGEVEDKLLVKL